MNIEEKLMIAKKLQKEKKYFVSNKIFVLLSSLSPNDAYLHYECARSYEKINKSFDAISHYELAIENGLTGNELLNTYLSLIQIYHSFGETNKSQHISKQALSAFPHNEILSVFLNISTYRLNSSTLLSELLQSDPTHDENEPIEYTLTRTHEELNKSSITIH